MIEPPVVPIFQAPRPPDLPAPVLELPRAELPSYKPIFIPPAIAADDTPPVRVGSVSKPAEPERAPQQDLQQRVEEALRRLQAAPSVRPVSVPSPAPPVALPAPAEVTQLSVPGTSLTIPVPKAAILSAAATTSVISVGATLTATSIFKRLVTVLKPAIKAAVQKVQKLRGKPVESWARQRLRERHQRKGGRTASQT